MDLSFAFIDLQTRLANEQTEKEKALQRVSELEEESETAATLLETTEEVVKVLLGKLEDAELRTLSDGSGESQETVRNMVQELEQFRKSEADIQAELKKLRSELQLSKRLSDRLNGELKEARDENQKLKGDLTVSKENADQMESQVSSVWANYHAEQRKLQKEVDEALQCIETERENNKQLQIDIMDKEDHGQTPCVDPKCSSPTSCSSSSTSSTSINFRPPSSSVRRACRSQCSNRASKKLQLSFILAQIGRMEQTAADLQERAINERNKAAKLGDENKSLHAENERLNALLMIENSGGYEAHALNGTYDSLKALNEHLRLATHDTRHMSDECHQLVIRCMNGVRAVLRNRDVESPDIAVMSSRMPTSNRLPDREFSRLTTRQTNSHSHTRPTFDSITSWYQPRN